MVPKSHAPITGVSALTSNSQLDPDSTPSTGVTDAAFVEMVVENAQVHTKAQQERASKARKLLQALGFPTVKDLKYVIQRNAIQDCPVTLEDVELAEKIYGPNVASIKGKTTHQKPTPVRSNLVEIPFPLLEAQRGVDLCFDTMFVNQIPFLTTVSKRILYRSADPLPNKKP